MEPSFFSTMDPSKMKEHAQPEKVADRDDSFDIPSAYMPLVLPKKQLSDYDESLVKGGVGGSGSNTNTDHGSTKNQEKEELALSGVLSPHRDLSQEQLVLLMTSSSPPPTSGMVWPGDSKEEEVAVRIVKKKKKKRKKKKDINSSTRHVMPSEISSVNSDQVVSTGIKTEKNLDPLILKSSDVPEEENRADEGDVAPKLLVDGGGARIDQAATIVEPKGRMSPRLGDKQTGASVVEEDAYLGVTYSDNESSVNMYEMSADSGMVAPPKNTPPATAQEDKVYSLASEIELAMRDHGESSVDGVDEPISGPMQSYDIHMTAEDVMVVPAASDDHNPPYPPADVMTSVNDGLEERNSLGGEGEPGDVADDWLHLEPASEDKPGV